MPLIKDTNFYRYIISEFNIIYPDTTTTKLTHAEVLGLGIEKDFDNCYYPLLNVKLLLDYITYYKIMENKTTVRFKFKLGKYIVDKETMDVDGVNNKKFIETVFDCTFGIYIDDDVMAMDKDLYEKTLETIGEQALSKTAYDFYLFKDEDLKSGKFTINRVLSNCNMTNTLMYLFSKSGMKNLLMSPLDNSRTYSEVLIPYIPLTQTVKFLEQHYGFYKSGHTFFFDFNTAYFIAKYGKSVYRTGEYNTAVMTFFKPGATNSLTPGCYKDKASKKLIIHVSQNNMTPLTESIVQEQIGGTNVAVVDASSDGVNDVTPDVDTRANKTTKVVVNKFENPYLNSMILFKRLENSKVVDVMLYDVDLSFLTPNKIYIFTFEDKATQKAYGGNYRLVNYNTTYKKEGTNFSVTVQARFKTTSFNQSL